MTVNSKCIRTLNRFKTLEQEFSKMHKDKYDYSLVIFKGMNINIDIICPIHGVFSQRPTAHLAGAGCLTCSGKKKHTQKEFITKVVVTCKQHGDFLTLPLNFLYKGKGCRKCDNVRKTRTKATKEEFVQKAKQIHKDKYDYNNVNYVDSNTLVSITCLNCKKDFMLSPNKHIQSRGCPTCGRNHHGFEIDKPGMLYYVRVKTPTKCLYKIGITNRTIKERFYENRRNKSLVITEIYCKHYKHGIDAYNAEQLLLKKFDQYKYRGEPVLKSGNTELLTKNIINDLKI